MNLTDSDEEMDYKAMDTVVLPSHKHPLYRRDGVSHRCDGCRGHVSDNGKYGSRHYYVCSVRGCSTFFHADCAESPQEISHPFHPKHPLTLLSSGPPSHTEKKCWLCEEHLTLLVYHCSICNFNIDMICARSPPRTDIEPPKSHKHKLTVLPRHISFTCDTCGLDGNSCPYACLQCDFMVHRDCTDLPHVIKIIRHQHRLSLTYSLPPGALTCGVCHKEVDKRYGAFSCNKGCTYAVHTMCATRKEVWDGIDLEGVPEDTDDEPETLEPFERVDEKRICYFSHTYHHLTLNEDGNVCDQTNLCQACILPVSSDPFYSCVQCDDFILHEACASLPRKKPHALHPHPLALHANAIPNDDSYKHTFTCSACDRLCGGFSYKCEKFCFFEIDVRCASISEPFIHESHRHPLFLALGKGVKVFCKACGARSSFVLNCIDDCNFTLCFKCATYPQKVRYRYDEHPVTLRCGEDGSGTYWCEICEKELDPKKWFYTCDDCGVNLHVNCALGNLPFVKPGQSVIFRGSKYDMAPNNRTSRPFCSQCYNRCQETLVFKRRETYLCSLKCVNNWSLLNWKVMCNEK